MAKRIDLEYAFPEIGKVTVSLHDESINLYKYFELINEIDRLEHLDHLGMLRSIHKTAHYSRWEYVMLQLHFIDVMKEAHGNLGLSSKIDVGGIRMSSGEEYLKCLIFLLNSSHLFGIFDSERVWMDLLTENAQLRKVFIESMPTSMFKKAATKIIEDQQLYNLHKLIGLIYLEHNRLKSKAAARTKWPWKLWQNIIESSINTPELGSTMASCLTVFRRLRKMAFVTLDINSCPLGIRINPTLLLNQLKEHPSELLYEDEGKLISQVGGLEKILFENIYSNEDVVEFRRRYIASQKLKAYALLDKHKGRPVDFTKGKKVLREKIYSARTNDFGKTPKKVEHRHFVRIELTPDELFPLKSLRYYDEQKWMSDKAGLKDWDFIITPAAHLKSSGGMLDVFCPKNPDLKDKATATWILVKYIELYLKEYKSIFPELMEMNLWKPAQTLFKKTLNLFMKVGLKVNFARSTTPIEGHASCKFTGNDLARWRKQFKKECHSSSLKNDRKFELEILINLLSKEKRGMFLIACSNVEIADDAWNKQAEIDGVYFLITKRTIKCVLMEAKRGTSRTSMKCKSALIEKVKKTISSRFEPRIYRGKGYAWTQIMLSETV